MNLTLQDIGFGLTAAIATVLLCLGVATGSALSFLLYFLSAVPLMVATLGWGARVGTLGAIASALMILFVANFATALFIVATTIFPAVMAGFLMNLARPAEEIGGPAGKMVWYPLSDVIFRLAIITAASFIVAGFLIGYGPALVDPLVNEFLVRYRDISPSFSGFSPEALVEFKEFILYFLPLLQTSLWVMLLTANLAIALSITRRSGRLKRPRDDWAFALRMPRSAGLIFAGAVIVSLVPGALALAANAIIGALMGGFILSGFAQMHAATRGQPWQPVALFVAYFATIIMGFPIIAFFIIGMFATARAMPVSDKSNQNSNDNENT
ncbi:MAG: DUF2232 domain-containing protein [Pseudomonadota bacterium]